MIDAFFKTGCLFRPDFPLAVTISVDNRRLVARLVPAANRTEAEVTRLDISTNGDLLKKNRLLRS